MKCRPLPEKKKYRTKKDNEIGTGKVFFLKKKLEMQSTKSSASLIGGPERNNS